MRRIAILWCAATLVGCAKSGNKRTDTTPAAGMPAATPQGAPTISLASIAGKWNMKVTNQAGDSTLMTEVITATADPSGWTVAMPGRPPEPIHVTSVAGDSIVADEGPFESALRKGVQVTTHSVYRLENGKLVGTTVARYKTTRPDSLLVVRREGTRAP